MGIKISYYKSNEHFQQYYKSHLVQLKEEVSHPLTIAVGNKNTYVSQLIEAYSNKFPLIIYNNDEKKEYNFGKLSKLI